MLRLPVPALALGALVLLGGCPRGKGDGADTSETGDSGETGESGESAETADSSETGDSADTGDSAETADSSETADSGDSSADSGHSDESGVRGDTGLAQMWMVGHVTTARGELVSAELGISLADTWYYPELRSVCSVVGPATEAPGRLPACSACDWAFHFVISDSVARGDDCGDFGLEDGWMDGYDGSYGWADEYELNDGGGTQTVSEAVFYYFATYRQWYLIAYNDGGYGYNSGNAADATFNLPLNVYYYFYP